MRWNRNIAWSDITLAGASVDEGRSALVGSALQPKLLSAATLITCGLVIALQVEAGPTALQERLFGLVYDSNRVKAGVEVVRSKRKTESRLQSLQARQGTRGSINGMHVTSHWG